MKEFKVMHKRLDYEGKEHWFNISAPYGSPIRKTLKSRDEAERMMEVNKKAWAERQAHPDLHLRSDNPPTEWRIMVRDVTDWTQSLQEKNE